MRTARPFEAVVATSGFVLAALVALAATNVGRPYPGFLSSPDYRVLPVAPDVRTVGLAPGDRIVAVDGGSPLDLVRRVRQGDAPVRLFRLLEDPSEGASTAPSEPPPGAGAGKAGARSG